MHDRFFKSGKRMLLYISLSVPGLIYGQSRTWTGNGGDGLWSNPQNWDGAALPVISDNVVLDNGDVPGSYRVVLPDYAVAIGTLTISPSPGNQIELVLPSTNILNDALSISGPGYGLLLNTGAVFRNSSGVASGESLRISDSVRINNGGSYIHNTRASHAAGIVQILSSAPGTEKGIFEFDVPRASYTISASNRIYGSLVLSSLAYGSAVNYTCSGSNPLSVRGDLRIGPAVNLSVNLSGVNGNIQVGGDLIQEGGVLNLASGAGNSSILQIAGNISQSPGAAIIANSDANPGIELNGNRLQLVSAGGGILNGISFSVNNPSGCELLSGLTLPYRLDLIRGVVFSSPENLLTLSASCGLQADSASVNRPYIDGPLRKEGLDNEPQFLFPVGKNGMLRWLELKQASGNFTVEYMDGNPAALGGDAGTGIDHISAVEYWKVKADGPAPVAANIELSYASPWSGEVTDPAFLDVAGYSGGRWIDEGHAAITGDILYGSVLSIPVHDFSGEAFTLASTASLENPLPLTLVRFEGTEKDGYAFFSWETGPVEGSEYFDLAEESGGKWDLMARIPAAMNRTDYSWKTEKPLEEGSHFYKLTMMDPDGNRIGDQTVTLRYFRNKDLQLFWSPAFLPGGNEIRIVSAFSGFLDYRIISMTGEQVQQGRCFIQEGATTLELPDLSPGIYLFCGRDAKGRTFSIKILR
jgi:hypothetical protein